MMKRQLVAEHTISYVKWRSVVCRKHEEYLSYMNWL